MRRIRALIRKEWAEVFQDKKVLGTVTLMPVIMTILMTTLTVIFSRAMGGQEMSASEVPAHVLARCGTTPLSDCMLAHTLQSFFSLFLIQPVAIPSSIAAYSIAGEKTTRTLEPLLATPLRTEELIIGKGLAAVLPAVASTIGSYLLFVGLTRILVDSPAVAGATLGSTWLLAVFVVGPLLSCVTVLVVLVASARATDPRSAEAYAGVLILPLVSLMLLGLFGIVTLSAVVMMMIAACLVVSLVFLLRASVALFDRETILSKWS